MSNFGETTHPTARKQYQCEYCFGPIPKGEKHSRWSGMFDGEFQSNRMHLECEADFRASGEDEYSSGSAEMPERVKQIVKALKEKALMEVTA